jgi:hypothetical protein
LAGGPASAGAVWQSVLSSFGVGASATDAREPAIDRSLDSDADPEQGTGSNEAKPLSSGSASSPRTIQVTISSVPGKSGQEFAAQQLAGRLEPQQRSGTGSNFAAEGTRKSPPAEAGFKIGSSKVPEASDSEGADSTHKRKNAPGFEEAAPLQSALIPSQPIQQDIAAPVPHAEALWKEKSAFVTAQAESASEANLAVPQGLADLATARTPSNRGAENVDLHARTGLPDAEPVTGSPNPAPWKSSESPLETSAAPAVQEPASEALTSATSTFLDSPIKTRTVAADSAGSGAARAADGPSDATQARSPSPEPGGIAKNRELSVSPREPILGTQSTAAASIPGVAKQENRASKVVEDAAGPGNPHAREGSTENGTPAIQVPANGNIQVVEAPGPVVVPSIGATSSAAVSHGAPGPGEAFAALDAEGANRVTWVHAGAQQAEAGFQDPRLGWVSVRADVSGGAIHAALVPATVDAAQVMGGHLDGLNAYLSEHHSAVETITLASPGGSAHESGENRSFGEGMQQQSGQGSNQDNGQGAGGGLAANGQSNVESDVARTSAGSNEARDAEQETGMQTSPLGGRISVMA